MTVTTAPAPAPVVEWTVVSRPERGRYFRPVANVPAGLDWHAARAIMQTALNDDAIPYGTDVWLTPSREAEATDYVCAEDKGNIMLPNGRRVPIRWDAEADLTVLTTLALI